MIELRNLTKIFPSANGPLTVLDNVNLEIPNGEIFGIIGLSGAGKSTLIRCINLLERPTEGNVVIDGEDLTNASDKRLRQIRRNIGMIFQGFNLLEQRNVFDNIRFPLEIAGVKKAEAKERVNELLKLIDLTDKATAYPCQLSGGQKQRVAIARALALSPKYLLCDEATSALDPQMTASVLELLKKINKEFGVTVVVITHEMDVVESICTSVAVIDKSSITEKGKVQDVFADPRSDAAKRLIVPEQILHKEVGEDQKKLRLIFKGVSLDAPVISGLALENGVAVSILYADTKIIDGKSFGHMVIAYKAESDKEATLKAYLEKRGVEYKEEK